MIPQHERRVDRLEAERAVQRGGDLAGRLARARKEPLRPTHTRAELEQLATLEGDAARVARGWLRLGERFYLAEGPERPLPAIDVEDAIVRTLGALSLDPLGYAAFAFEGLQLRTWQRELLEDIGNALETGNRVGFDEAIQRAVSSGHAAGKSTVVAILILWALSTFEDARVVVTANTESQLQTKTMPELAKWHRLAINGHWFTYTATALYSTDKRHERNWRADALPWNEARPEGFAGLHNQGRRILLVFDEASAIVNRIWEVAEGALTDAGTQMIWLACGNPTRATGRFHDALTKLAHRWRPRFIDTRHVEGVSQAQVAAYIEDYGGLESDFVRVRILGLPPRASSMQFIARDLIEQAMAREGRPQRGYAAIVGVDVARFGSDRSVIRTRIGRDARMFPPIRLKGLDTMQVAARVAEHINLLRAGGPRVVTFVDGGGVGGGVIDRLKQLGYHVVDVQFGGRADDPRRYANKRAEMYGRLRDALKEGLALAPDTELLDELASIDYSFTATDQIILERKEHMRSRGLASPDDADALALTYAFEVAVDVDESARAPRPKRDHDPYANLNCGHNPLGRR